MAYKKLNEALKKELLKKVDEMEINVEELKSYHFEKNPYCVEPQLIGTSGEGQWDENEEWQAKIQKAKKYLSEEPAYELLTLADEDYDDDDQEDCTTLTNECINYLSTLEN
jgi:hypothetical protein